MGNEKQIQPPTTPEQTIADMALKENGAFDEAENAACREGAVADRTGRALNCLTKFAVNNNKQEELKETSRQKGINSARKILSALKDNPDAQKNRDEMENLWRALGFNPLKNIDSLKDIEKAIKGMDDDHLYNIGYYGVDDVVAKWNATPETKPDQDAGAAFATTENPQN